jgi:uncharacterized protein YgiM (DUF1202 family)
MPGELKGSSMSKQILIFLALILLLSACSMPGISSPTLAPGATYTPVAPATLPPTLTPVPTLISTPTVIPSPTPFVPFNAPVWADNVNVRTNPGYLFPVARLIARNSNLLVLGKSPGGEWTYAQIADGTKGWVFTQLIQSERDLQAVPVIEPQGVQLIKGRVTDSQGMPTSGVGFSVLQGTGDRPPTNTVMTDANGDFYSFMPTTASGEWAVSYSAIACKSNVWKDDTCTNYKDGYTGTVDPQVTTVTLPQGTPLLFTWK